MWRSLVARVVRDDEAAGSNPVTPTMSIRGAAFIAGAYEHPRREIPDRSIFDIHTEVALGALADAGLTMSDVDAVFCDGTAGMGTVPHLAAELFSTMSGAKLTQVHYKGAGPALADLIGGQVQVIFSGYGVVRQQAASGNVRVLAVGQKTRLSAAPNIPTMEEAGLPGYDVSTWFGVVGPKAVSYTHLRAHET